MRRRLKNNVIDLSQINLQGVIQDYLMYGTHEANDNATLPVGWVAIDMDLRRLRLHDGVTKGGVAEFGNFDETEVTNSMRLLNYMYYAMYELSNGTLYVVKLYQDAWLVARTIEISDGVFSKLYTTSYENSDIELSDLTEEFVQLLDYKPLDEVEL